MNRHVFSQIYCLVRLNSSFACLKWIARAFCINTLFKFHDYCFLNNVDVWHKTLDCVSGDDFETDIHVPLRHVVRKWTIKCFPEFSWSELLQICIHNENDKTCVEELTYEGTLNNRSFLLGNCIFANP